MDTNETLPIDPLAKVLVDGVWVFKTKVHCAKYDRMYNPDMPHCEGCDCEKSGEVIVEYGKPPALIPPIIPTLTATSISVPPVAVSAAAKESVSPEETSRLLARSFETATTEAATLFAIAVGYVIRKGFAETEAERIVLVFGVSTILAAYFSDEV